MSFFYASVSGNHYLRNLNHLNNLKAAGKIPFIQIDGRVMYLANDIAKYIIMQKAKL